MSPRPKKPRNCCHAHPAGKVFKPTKTPLKELTLTTLFIDEMEALHLCDGQGFTQEEAGRKMGVSRGTIQRLVTIGRKKIVDAIVNGQALVVDNDDEG
jgi:predicted DNA-binding protein (UPF0251 family)